MNKEDKKKVIYVLTVFIIGAIIVLCIPKVFKASQSRQFNDIGGINFSAGTVISSTDTHGGFHGDGYTLIQIQCSEENVEQQMDVLDTWHKLPLSDELNTFVYQPYDSEIEIPIIENGYFYFYDRHSEADDPYSDTDLLKRFSFNFTFAIYDSDTEILYYCDFDT